MNQHTGILPQNDFARPPSDDPVDVVFTRFLPKAELHAHLSGSISRDTLHSIWLTKPSPNRGPQLQDPLSVFQPGSDSIDVISFFPLFDKYIYNLCDDVETVKFATKQVIEDFRRDGVRYLELRTTPRENIETGMTKLKYVEAVNEVVAQWNTNHGDEVEVYLILSIDRRMESRQALEVVDLAINYRYSSSSALLPLPEHHSSLNTPGHVVAVDLCGNPNKGDVSTFTSAFSKAKAYHLGITVHFAEIPASSTDFELATILSWRPDRLGHCINVPENIKSIIREHRLALELCLSCNILAKLTSGGFAKHHFGEWRETSCRIALSTDDVGIFGSSLSNEYLLAAKYFSLDRSEIVKLSRDATSAAFAGRDRMMMLLDQFEKGETCSRFENR